MKYIFLPLKSDRRSRIGVHLGSTCATSIKPKDAGEKLRESSFRHLAKASDFSKTMAGPRAASTFRSLCVIRVSPVVTWKGGSFLQSRILRRIRRKQVRTKEIVPIKLV